MSGIIPVVPLAGSISGTLNLTGTITPDGFQITGEVSSDLLTKKKYDGPYEVIPRKVPQTLPTSDKLMVRDVEINEINYSAVDNVAGGLTVNIGYE